MVIKVYHWSWWVLVLFTGYPLLRKQFTRFSSQKTDSLEELGRACREIEKKTPDWYATRQLVEGIVDDYQKLDTFFSTYAPKTATSLQKPSGNLKSNILFSPQSQALIEKSSQQFRELQLTLLSLNLFPMDTLNDSTSIAERSLLKGEDLKSQKSAIQNNILNTVQVGKSLHIAQDSTKRNGFLNFSTQLHNLMSSVASLITPAEPQDVLTKGKNIQSLAQGFLNHVQNIQKRTPAWLMQHGLAKAITHYYKQLDQFFTSHSQRLSESSGLTLILPALTKTILVEGINLEKTVESQQQFESLKQNPLLLNFPQKTVRQRVKQLHHQADNSAANLKTLAENLYSLVKNLEVSLVKNH